MSCGVSEESARASADAGGESVGEGGGHAFHGGHGAVRRRRLRGASSLRYRDPACHVVANVTVPFLLRYATCTL